MGVGHDSHSSRVLHARQADIIAVLRSRGEELVCLNRSKGEYKVKGHQGLTVHANHYYLHSNNGKLETQKATDSNNTLTFVMHFYGMDFNQAVDYLCDFPTVSSSSYTSAKDYEKIPDDYIAEPLYPISDNYRCVMGYLIKHRGLSEDTVKEMLNKKLLKQDERRNCAFAIYDFENQKHLLGYELRGTYTNDPDPNKKPFKNCSIPNGCACGFNFKIGDPEGVLYFESAIDLLSYYQMYKKDLSHHWLVSLSGVKQVIVQRMIDTFPDYKHCICTDNDDAGNGLFPKIAEANPQMLEEKKLFRLKPPKEYKDWNEMLVDIKK